MDNKVIRGNTMVSIVRQERRASDRLTIQVANISDNNIKYRLFVGGLGDNLMKVGVDVKEEFDIQVVLVATTNEGTARVGCSEAIIAGTDMLDKFGFLFAARRAIESTNNNFLDGTRCSGFDKSPADFKIRWDMDGKFAKGKTIFLITESDGSTPSSSFWPRVGNINNPMYFQCFLNFIFVFIVFIALPYFSMYSHLDIAFNKLINEVLSDD